MDGSGKEQVGDWRKDKRRARKLALRDPSVKLINVSFFAPLTELANTVMNLVDREGEKRFPGGTISADIAVMLNQLRVTFALLCFVNADERRDTDPDYRLGYSFVSLSLIRNLIDGFYNITVLLDDPSKSRIFRLSGYKRMLKALKETENLYGNESGWPEYIAKRRASIHAGLAADGFLKEHLTEKANWTLLGRYLDSDAANDTTHKKLMRRFVHGPWGQYSEMAHSTFSGLAELFAVLNIDNIPRQDRPIILKRAEQSISQHLGRAAAVLLAVTTEIQAVYRFKGHNVNSRIHAMWREVINFPDAEDMYTLHYKALLQKSIPDVPSDAL